MASYFNLTLDTTGPANPQIVLESGAQYATQQLINAALSCSDADKTGYQIKIWGDVDTTYDADVQDTEANSNWISWTATKQIKLASGEGSKTVYFKVRDDVWNQSGQASASIILDTTRPIVTISGPDVSKISKVSGKNVASLMAMSMSAKSIIISGVQITMVGSFLRKKNPEAMNTLTGYNRQDRMTHTRLEQ